MPGGDRTGPPRSGAGYGRKGGNRPGAGPGGECLCPTCGARIPHKRGIPCYNVNCPKCGGKMARA